jgi:DNA-binding NarL/FixJ family response regulator
LRWSLNEGDSEPGLRLVGALWLFWFTRGHSTEGRGWLAEALSLGGPPPARAKALKGAGWISLFQGDSGAAKLLLEEGLALYRELEDEEGIASTLNFLGYVALLGSREDVPIKDLLQEALALRPRLENRRTVANTLVFAGLGALLLRGDWDEGAALHEEALALYREMGDKWGITICLMNLGLAAAALVQNVRARALLRELMHVSRELDDKLANQYAFFGLACVADSEGHTARAAWLWGVSEAIREVAGIQTWAEGKATTPEDAVEYALSDKDATPTPAYTPEEPPVGKLPEDLTRRELEIVALVARGYTNRQIAEELTISEHTVETHVGKTLKKLGLRSRVQVAAWVAKQGPLA